MGDNSSGRLVSFLLEGEDVVSCEVCLEPFQPTVRPPKILPCGHNFCENCLFSICCHQQYYLLDSISCPTCRTPFSTAVAMTAPTNYDLCKILENVQRGRELNVTIIHVPDSTTVENGQGKTKITQKCKMLAEKSTEARHQRCMDCSRKISSKLVAKTSRYCEVCSPEGISFACLECCVNKHNGHKLMSLSEMEINQLKVLSELRDLRIKVLDASEAFDQRMDQLRAMGRATQCPTLHSSKQNLLTETLSSLDDSIRKIEASSTLPPALLSDLRNQQIQNYSKMTKMNTYLEKSSQGHKDPVNKTIRSCLSSSSSAIRQSRLTLRSDDSLVRESLCSLVSILPDSPLIVSLSEIINNISSKDTIEERKEMFHNCVNIITQILYGEIPVSCVPMFADSLLNCFYQLNVLSRKRVQPTNGKRNTRQDIWKSIQFAYMEILKIAAKNYPAYHPERVDLLDDLAYLCHLYADVCDEATVTICMIEAARARAAEGSLSEEERIITGERLNLIDDHLLECRRQQKLQELRTTKTKKDNKLKKIWKSCFQMQRVLA